ncbi:MAG: DUF1816 domain-containing protein [Cyanobacteria bacterium P01_A01_bin.123]
MTPSQLLYSQLFILGALFLTAGDMVMMSPFRFDSPSPWWVEVCTAAPRCTYYFGPFDSVQEAQRQQGGYVTDLVLEGAQGIIASTKQCKPQALTMVEEGRIV